jgi:RNA polymerase sigma-70 factor, ECF subfamily
MLTLLLSGGEAGLIFDEIIDTYEKRVFNLIYRLIGDYEEAADLTQDTFVSAYRAYGKFRFECSVYSWLCRIAVNHCKNRFRERDKQRQYEDTSLDVSHESSSLIPAEDGSSPDRQVERKELRERIAEAITSLPEDYRVVAVLRDLQGLSYQEIAEATELSLDNVKVRLSRARAMLRKKLGPYLDNSMP